MKIKHQLTIRQINKKSPDLLKYFSPAVIISILAFVLYLNTLAPTVLWGDDAELQRIAILNLDTHGERNYRVWTIIAHQFTRLPFGDMAWRVNIVSAFFSALTVGIMYMVMEALRFSRFSSLASCIALSVSHTFWLHAVRAEIYSFALFYLSLILLLVIYWYRSPESLPTLAFALLLLTAGLFIHALVLTMVPAVILLILSTKKPNRGRVYLVSATAVVTGLLLYLPSSENLVSQFNFSAWIRGAFGLSAGDVLLWVGYLGFQFLILIPVGLLGLYQFFVTERKIFLFLLATYFGNVGLILSFKVPDQYVFYLPSYLIYTIWIGKGVEFILMRFRNRPRLETLMVLIVLATPFITYKYFPLILNNLEINLLSVRKLPYRDNNLFFLYPPKNNYYGAREYGEQTLTALPPNAALLVDHSPHQVLKYLQEVEGFRQDVQLVDSYVESGQSAWLLEQAETRPVFIAGDGQYYDVEEISNYFDISPFGLIYKLEKHP